MGLATALDAMGSNALTDELGALPESQFGDAVQQLDTAPYLAGSGSAVPAITTVNGHVAGRLAGLRSGSVQVGYMQEGLLGMTFAQAAQDPQMLDHALDVATAPARRVHAQADQGVEGTLLGWRPHVKVYGTFADHDTTSNQTGYGADTVGFLAGLDAPLGEWTNVGVLLGYSFTDVDYDRSRGDAEIHSLRVGPYATFSLDKLFVDTSLTMGYHWNEAERKVTVGGFNRTADSQYDAWDMALYGGVGYDLDLGFMTLTPVASLQWVHYEQESFKESGAGPANLDVDSWDTDSLRHVVALKANKVIETGRMKIVPEAYLGWGHEYLEDDKISSKFVGQTTPFAFESDADNRDSLLFGAGVSFLLEENVSLYLRYDSDWDSNQAVHNVSAGLQIKF
jgi:outer membrane autotransporter protein